MWSYTYLNEKIHSDWPDSKCGVEEIYVDFFIILLIENINRLFFFSLDEMICNRYLNSMSEFFIDASGHKKSHDIFSFILKIKEIWVR